MRIAAAQTAPAWGDPDSTKKIVTDWIGRAADEGVELLAFGETFMSGYPYWMARTDAARWNAPDKKEAYAFYLGSAVAIDGPEMNEVVEAVRDHGVFTYLGITERSDSGGTVYASYVAIDPDRGILSSHRKMMPTYDERMAWGIGDGHGLRVHDVGDFKVSGLNCWENWVPTIRHTMYAQGTQLHVASWPGSVGLTKHITRFIAMEGRCYVLSAGSLLRADSIPGEFPARDASLGDDDGVLYNGGSAIAGPDGKWLVEPVDSEERLVMADIDVERVRGERQNFDPAGHYFRGDVIDVKVDRTRLSPVTFED